MPLLLVAMPLVTSSFLRLVVRLGALVASLLLVAMPFVTSLSGILNLKVYKELPRSTKCGI